MVGLVGLVVGLVVELEIELVVGLEGLLRPVDFQTDHVYILLVMMDSEMLNNNVERAPRLIVVPAAQG